MTDPPEGRIRGPPGPVDGQPFSSDDGLPRPKTVPPDGLLPTQALVFNLKLAMQKIQDLTARGQYPGLRYVEEARVLQSMTIRATIKALVAGGITWGMWAAAWRSRGGLSVRQYPFWGTMRLVTVAQAVQFGVFHETHYGLSAFNNLPDSVVLDHVCPVVLDSKGNVGPEHLRMCEEYTSRRRLADGVDGEAALDAGDAASADRSWLPAPSIPHQPAVASPGSRPKPLSSVGRDALTSVHEDPDGVLRIDSR